MSLYPNRHASTVALVSFDKDDYGNHSVETKGGVMSEGEHPEAIWNDAVFIPEIWSKEVLEAYKANLFLSNMVSMREYYANDAARAIAEDLDRNILANLQDAVRGEDEDIITFLDRTSTMGS